MMKNESSKVIELPKLCVGCLREGNGLNAAQFVPITHRKFEFLRKSRRSNLLEVRFYLCGKCLRKAKKKHQYLIFLLAIASILDLIILYITFLTLNKNIIIFLTSISFEITILEILSTLLFLQWRFLRNPTGDYLKIDVPHLPYYITKRKSVKIPIYLKIKDLRVLKVMKARLKVKSKEISLIPLRQVWDHY
ncbi:MAG: hypothetical protein K9W44_17320 [Candidatus Lokiarchaeota archaeon]|nr:hypothetical protein [Candidatus Harpocratesius repetitus]